MRWTLADVEAARSRIAGYSERPRATKRSPRPLLPQPECSAQRIDLLIPDIAPSLNVLLRMERNKRAKLIKLWDRWIMSAIAQHRYAAYQGTVGLPKLPIWKSLISIERRSRGALDPDNLYGAAKVVIDALRHNDLIQNDSPDHVQLVINQSKGVPQTLIRIEVI